MPSEPAAPLERLHPVSLLFGIGSAARNLLLPGVLVLFASRGGNYEAWFMVLFVPAVASYLLRYLTYGYRLAGEEMIVRDGILTRNERHIPYARIQNIDLVQNPLHRLFRVAVVRLETASGGRPEAVIRVLSLAQIEAMRRRVFEGRGVPYTAFVQDAAAAEAPEASTPAVRRLLALPTSEIVRYGLISNRGLVVVAAATGLLFQAGIDDVIERSLGLAARTFESWSLPFGGRALPIALVALAGVAAVLVLMRVLSVSWAVLRLHGFTLTLRGEDLRAEYGLLTRVSATIPRHRIQLLSVHSSWLHRRFRRVSLYIETAGGGADPEEGARVSERQWLAPVLAEGRAADLIREVLPEIDLDAAGWHPIEPRAWRRLLTRGLVLVAVLAAVPLAAFGAWGLIVPALGIPWALFHARRWTRSAAWAETASTVMFRSGWWNRRLSVVRQAKIQALGLHRTPFDRRTGMATVAVDTAGAGTLGHRVHIPFLAEADARSLADRLYAAAGRLEFRWR